MKHNRDITKRLMSDSIPEKVQALCETAAIEIDILRLEVAELKAQRDILAKHVCTMYATDLDDVIKRARQVAYGMRDQHMLMSARKK